MIDWKNSLLAKNAKGSHIFMHLLLDCKSRAKDFEIMWQGRRRKLKAGELLIAGRNYAFDVGLSHTNFVDGLRFLRQCGLIRFEGSRQGTLVEILDYENKVMGVVA